MLTAQATIALNLFSRRTTSTTSRYITEGVPCLYYQSPLRSLMVQLTDVELELVDELLKCIAEAMAQLENINPEYANRTKLQKLLYLSIDGFGLPVTYSWYLAGAVLPGNAGTLNSLDSAFDDLPETETPMIEESSDGSSSHNERGPESTGDEDIFEDVDDTAVLDDTLLDSTVETESSSRIDEGAAESTDIDPILFTNLGTDDTTNPPEQDGGIGDRRREIVDFYVTVIPEVWHQNTMRFLQNFYLDHAPPKYRDLYVQSTHLRTHLQDIEMVAAHPEENQPNQSIPELVKATGLEISDLHCTIRSSETLSTTFDGFVRGTDLIEDGLMMLAQLAPNELEREHIAVIRSMQDFYYYYVWRYPCLIISQETATGPSEEILRESRNQQLTEFEMKLERHVEHFEQELADAGLKPDHTDYPSSDDDVETMINVLADHYIDTAHGQ